MAVATGIQAKAKPPKPDGAGGSSSSSGGPQNQQHFMSEIVKGMQLRDMSSVATTLSNAVAARVSLPETFLATVKQWMDSRSQTAMASMQMSNLRQPSVPMAPPQMASVPAARPQQASQQQQQQPANFQELEKRLEQAIIRKDTQAMQAILHQAGQVTGMRVPGLGPMMPPGAYMGGMMSLPGSVGSMTPTPGMAVGAMTPQMARQYMGGGAMTPQMPGYPGMAGGFAYGGITPQMASAGMPGMVGFPHGQGPTPGQQQQQQQQQQQPPGPGGSAAAAGSMTPAASQAASQQQPVLPTADAAKRSKKRDQNSPSHSPTFVPTESPGEEAADITAKQENASRKRQRSSASMLLKSLTEPKQAKMEERTPKAPEDGVKMGVKADLVETKSSKAPDSDFIKGKSPEEPVMMKQADPQDASPMPEDVPPRALDFGFPALPDEIPPAFQEPPSQPTLEQIAAFLRTQPKDTAKFKDICKSFQPPAAKEFVRKQVEGNPAMFTIIVDRVTLKDPRRKESLNLLVQEIVRREFLNKQIRPQEISTFLANAARYALQATPEDVAKLLIEVAKNTLRRIGPVLASKYPANMPLVVACLIDRIVLTERQMGAAPRFEMILGPLVHKLIFHRWVLGVTPGSIFLANMLIAWDRMGYFQSRHLELPRKTCGLLVVYAKKDGIPDPPHKNEGTGWYSLVQRDGYVKGGEAILPARMLQHVDTLTPIDDMSTLGDEEQPTATATAPTVELPTAPTAPTVSLPSADKDATSAVGDEAAPKRKTAEAGLEEPPAKRRQSDKAADAEESAGTDVAANVPASGLSADQGAAVDAAAPEVSKDAAVDAAAPELSTAKDAAVDPAASEVSAAKGAAVDAPASEVSAGKDAAATVAASEASAAGSAAA